MPHIENASVAGTVAVVGLGASLFNAFLPDMPDLRTSDMNTENSTQVRHGQVIGSITTLAFAGVIAYWARSSVPLIAGVITVATLSAAYEITLRKEGCNYGQ